MMVICSLIPPAMWTNTGYMPTHGTQDRCGGCGHLWSLHVSSAQSAPHTGMLASTALVAAGCTMCQETAAIVNYIDSLLR